MTFIEAKLKKSEDLTNIVKYRVGVNITELILLRIIIPNFMVIMQLFHEKL